MEKRSILMPALLLYFIMGALLVSGQFKVCPYKFDFFKGDNTENIQRENLENASRFRKKEVYKNSDFRRAAERICSEL